LTASVVDRPPVGELSDKESSSVLIELCLCTDKFAQIGIPKLVPIVIMMLSHNIANIITHTLPFLGFVIGL
jgi:hypothetical protein